MNHFQIPASYQTFLLFLIVIYYEETVASDSNNLAFYKRLRRDASEGQPCCMVPHCEEIQIDVEDHTALKCYTKRVCGSNCKHSTAKHIPLPHSPYIYEYKIRDHYVRKVCLSDKCSSHLFDCSACPNPTDTSLLALGVHSDCLNCYY